MRKLFSDDEAKIVAKEYEDGATLQVLADKYRTDRSTVSRSVVRAGGTIRSQKESQKTTFSPEVCKEIRKDYETGETLWTLAKKYNCAHTTIRLSVIRAGGKMRSKSETVPSKQKRPYRIKRDILAKMVAAHTSGLRNAIPEQVDFDMADEILQLLEAKLRA